MRVGTEEQDESDVSDTEVSEETESAKPDLSYFSHQKYKDNILTIGCIGKVPVRYSAIY